MGEREWRVTAAVVLAAAAGMGVALALAGLPEQAPVPAPDQVLGPAGTGAGEPVGSTAGSAPAADGSGAEITVHVAGAVARPGLVLLPAGSRVADAIEAAGGTTGPDPPVLNLAAPLADGAQVVVPGPDEGGTPAADGAAAGPVPLNHADMARLEALPGVGPVLAERIVAHRLAHGPFATVEDLLAVPGIGEAKLAALRDLVAVP